MTFNQREATILALIGEYPAGWRGKPLPKDIHPEVRKIAEAILYPKKKHTKNARQMAKSILGWAEEQRIQVRRERY
jgi:hypothetical protein